MASIGQVSRTFKNISGASDNEIVAAVAGYKIKVLAFIFMSAGTVTATFKSASTAIAPGFPLAAGGGALGPINHGQIPWFETASGEPLNCGLSDEVAVGVHVIYKLETT
jgi:hypothetical protein